MEAFWKQAAVLAETSPIIARSGRVTELTGLIIEGDGPSVAVGTRCTIVQDGDSIEAQVVGFKKDRILLMPFEELHGVAPGAEILSYGDTYELLVGEDYLGRVIDPMGQPLDGFDRPVGLEPAKVFNKPVSPMERTRISEVYDVGIKAVNSMLTVGTGQRVGIMAGSGVGKSTFLGMIAKHSESDINVIALVGERGREVREFIERDLGEEGLKRSVVVCATSDSSPLLRIRAAFTATAIAEHFRDRGHNVNLLVDSITRFCMAQREIGLAIGEPPSTAGYTPSVFALLPKLLERAGTKKGAGAITAFYTVLVEGDDMNEPVADAVRGILDGHIVLSRKLAGRGHYPAIDILQSVSRVMSDVVDESQERLAEVARTVLADYAEAEDLITVGAYQPGANPNVDFAVEHIEILRSFLKQRPEERVSFEEGLQTLREVFN